MAETLHDNLYDFGQIQFTNYCDMKATSPRCVFCNSPSHTTAECNSNMKGRRKTLFDIGSTFMLDDTLPDFKSFPINELRFIVSIYEDFQKTSYKRYVKKYMCRYFGRKGDVVEYLYSPIPFTLTKNRMIIELTRRWRIYAPVRINHYHKRPEDNDCPICMDRMSTHTWNHFKLKWDVIVKPWLPSSMFNGNIRTLCGHNFCGSCWEMHLNANSKVEYFVNLFREEEPTGRMIVSCPMCRHQMYYVK